MTVTRIIRILGVILGTLFVAFAVAQRMDGYGDGRKHYLSDISIALMGLYFAYYGITGRPFKLRRRLAGQSDQNPTP